MTSLTIDKTKAWTQADYLLLGEMNTPCQLINGELIMSPSPRPMHQLILSNLYDVLKAMAKKKGDIVFFAPMDLYIDKKNVYQPDLMYIKKENRNIITERGIEGVPDIVVEVLSPSNIFTDRNGKKKVYQKFGVPELWLLDPSNRTLEIYDAARGHEDTPTLFLVEKGKVISSVLPTLKLNLASLFD